jgi:hypothetical protein
VVTLLAPTAILAPTPSFVKVHKSVKHIESPFLTIHRKIYLRSLEGEKDARSL